MNSTLTTLLISFIFLMSGCSANGPKYSDEYQVDLDDANVFVYRPDNFLSSAINAGVYIDGNFIGNLENGGYIKATIKEGKHSIKAGKQVRSFNVTANDKVFYKFNYGWALFFAIPISPQSLDLAPASTAVNELNETKSGKKI